MDRPRGTKNAPGGLIPAGKTAWVSRRVPKNAPGGFIPPEHKIDG